MMFGSFPFLIQVPDIVLFLIHRVATATKGNCPSFFSYNYVKFYQWLGFEKALP